jgi:hypothetical protein
VHRARSCTHVSSPQRPAAAVIACGGGDPPAPVAHAHRELGLVRTDMTSRRATKSSASSDSAWTHTDVADRAQLAAQPVHMPPRAQAGVSIRDARRAGREQRLQVIPADHRCSSRASGGRGTATGGSCGSEGGETGSGGRKRLACCS